MPIPEKDFFTLDEIEQRWKLAAVDSATLLKLATDDLLVFSVYVRDIGDHETRQETPDAILTRQHKTVFSFKSPDYKFPQLRYLKSDDARRILEARDGERIAVRGHYGHPSRNKESGHGYASAPYFTRADLLVSRIERDRFERTHGVRIEPPWPTRTWQWLSDQANQRTLTMLSGWVAAAGAAGWAVWLWWMQRPPAP